MVCSGLSGFGNNAAMQRSLAVRKITWPSRSFGLQLLHHTQYLAPLPMASRLRTKSPTSRAAILHNRRAKTQAEKRGGRVAASRTMLYAYTAGPRATSLSSGLEARCILRFHTCFGWRMVPPILVKHALELYWRNPIQ